MMLYDYLQYNPVYLILSASDKQTFIDQDRRSFACFYKETAKRLIGEHENTVCSEPVFLSANELYSTCYAAGATSVVLYGDAEDETTAIRERDCIPAFYNSSLNANVRLLMQTKAYDYLQNLKGEKFILPAKIKHSGKTEIVYGTVHLNNASDFYYLVFTDIDEYNKWASKIPGWSPLLADFDTIYQLGEKNGYIVNPSGTKFMLSAKTLKGIKKEIFAQGEKS